MAVLLAGNTDLAARATRRFCALGAQRRAAAAQRVQCVRRGGLGRAAVERRIGVVFDLELDLASSFSVGDRWHDVEAAQAVGARGVLVRTGHGRRDAAVQPPAVPGTVIADNLMEAVSWILLQS